MIKAPIHQRLCSKCKQKGHYSKDCKTKMNEKRHDHHSAITRLKKEIYEEKLKLREVKLSLEDKKRQCEDEERAKTNQQMNSKQEQKTDTLNGSETTEDFIIQSRLPK